VPRLTSRYALETFLRQLARTGNFALAADLAGLTKSGLYKRRARDSVFNQACEAALNSSPERGGGPPMAVEGAHVLTQSGDLAFSRYAGRPQRRRMPPGRLTGIGITNFFAALANSGNIRLAAKQVGVAPSSIHARRRTDPDFAAQVEEALDLARANIACALVQAAHRTFDPDWTEGIDPDGPKMTIGQAIAFVSSRRA
jgi:hypothetical protein